MWRRVGHRRGRPDGAGCRHRVPCVPRVGVSRRRRRTREPIRRAAGQALALGGAVQELGRRRLWGSGADSAARPMHLQRPQLRRPRSPRWRRGPIPRRVPPNGRIRGERTAVAGHRSRGRRPWQRGGDGARGCLGSISRSPGVRGLAACPILECGADRERARQAVRLLCATARGAGGDSAKQRCRWSGLVERPSRSSPNATNGQAGAPSMLGSPRSVIRAMIPGPFISTRPTHSPIAFRSGVSHAHLTSSQPHCRS